LPGLSEHLIGLNVSEDDQVIEYELSGEDLPEALAGRIAKFTISIKELKEETLPELDDEFVVSLDEEGVTTVSELEASLTKQLQESIDAKIQNDYREEILDLLLATASIEYPNILVERAIDQMIDRESNHASHTREGLEQWLESIGQSEEEVRSALQDNATISLRRELVLSELSTVEKIEVDAEAVDEQIDAAIESITSGQEGLEAQARQLIDTPDYRRTLASQQVIDNALARLEDICTAEFEDLVDDSESSTDEEKTSRRGSRRSKTPATEDAVSENTEPS
jgi:trigger factor